MRVNVDKVLERDQKLSELDDRAGEEILGLFVLFISLHFNISTCTCKYIILRNRIQT